jgi:methylmalonyl-CoA/ethylmalonyl-CoA epimerase
MSWRTLGQAAIPDTDHINHPNVSLIERVDHVGFAVRSIASAVPLYRDALGGTLMYGGDDRRLGIRSAVYKLANFKIELLEPLSDDSYLAAFMNRHGEGFHHLTVAVDDVESTIDNVEHLGFEVVGTDLSSRELWQETYIRPSSGLGCLIQIVKTPISWDEQHPTMTIDQILNGEWLWWKSQTWHATMLPEDYPF